jgi:flagellar basal-body rod protein FlgG
MRSLNIAATGMLAQQLNVEVISNNIANMNTTAYKRQRADFQDLLYQNVERIGANSADSGEIVPTGIQIGLGVKAGGVYRITEQGNMINTGNDIDVAIQGRGFFQVEMPNGDQGYTRSGSLQLSPNGELVTADGYLLTPSITIPQDADDIYINKTGEIQVKVAGQVDPTIVGQMQLSTFFNPAGLEAIGDNMFLETPASGPASTGVAGSAGFGTLLQGFLETSNVNPVNEITSLITAQRAYEMNSKVIQASDEMLSVTSNLR